MIEEHQIKYKGIEGIPVTGNKARKTSSRTFKPVRSDKCVKCKTCLILCPENAVKLENNKIVFDYDVCNGCGICAKECPAKAITMERDLHGS
jgi:pyruvate ferredoxin oxidoreductase delta subunit